MKTARNAIRLLRHFSRHEPELGVSELARRLDMDRAGVHRLLRSLVAERFVEQDPQSKLYRLGLGILDVAAVRISQHGLANIAPPHLERLRDEVGETVALLVPDGVEAVCLAVIESRSPVRVGYDIGERMPLHASAGGQVILSQFGAAERRAVYDAGLKRYTSRTLTDTQALEAHLARILEVGAGWAEDSYYEGIVSAAAPIMDPKQRLAGAVSIAAPALRKSLADLPAMAAAARRTADAISAEWAGLRPTQRLAMPTG